MDEFPAYVLGLGVALVVGFYRSFYFWPSGLSLMNRGLGSALLYYLCSSFGALGLDDPHRYAYWDRRRE